MTPAETLVRIEKLQAAKLDEAWLLGLMFRAAQSKTYPKSPDDLRKGRKSGEMDDATLVNLAKAMQAADAAEKNLKKPKVTMREA